MKKYIILIFALLFLTSRAWTQTTAIRHRKATEVSKKETTTATLPPAFVVYPNPSATFSTVYLKIDKQELSHLKLVVYNMQAEVVYTDDNLAQHDLSFHLEKHGTYIVRLVNTVEPQHSFSRKLVIE
jgi:hypothetical protein